MKLLWTRPAAEAFRRLPTSVREEISSRVELLSDFPEMYPLRTHRPYEGFRYFFARGWCVSYAAAEDTIVILAVFPARRG